MRAGTSQGRRVVAACLPAQSKIIDLSHKNSKIKKMGYALAISKAWEDLLKLNPENNLSVEFLGSEYRVDPGSQKVLSLSGDAPAKDFTSILILHYLAQEIKGLPALTGEWLTFREFSGIEGYFEVFRQRAIEPIIKKYAQEPELIKLALARLPAKLFPGAEAGIVIQVFKAVPVLVKLWKADDEFGTDANIYFDASIKNIFCTEDIIVLAGLVGWSL